MYFYSINFVVIAIFTEYYKYVFIAMNSIVILFYMSELTICVNKL